MSRIIAKWAVEAATQGPVGAVELLSSGRTSQAWLAETPVATFIARIPIHDSGRRMTYRVESFIGQHLAAQGHSVATWTVVNVHEQLCSVGPCLTGSPIGYGDSWTREFGRSLALVLRDLHQLPAQGFGPLADDDSGALGISPSRHDGVVDRWCHASIWPFDGSALASHPVVERFADLYEQLVLLGPAIKRAEHGLVGVVHSDLHREHLLINDDGSLAGVLDFGAAFIGAVAWDFGSLTWYYGKENADRVARSYPNGADELARGCLLAVAIGLYKAAKDPADKTVEHRLRRCVQLCGTI